MRLFVHLSALNKMKRKLYILGVFCGLGFVLSLFDLSLYLKIYLPFCLKFKGGGHGRNILSLVKDGSCLD